MPHQDRPAHDRSRGRGRTTRRGTSPTPPSSRHPGKGVEVRQHVSFDQCRRTHSSTTAAPPTNGAHALQFELVGTCDPKGPAGAYYWPDADDAVLTDLYAKVIRPVNVAFGVKLEAPPFRPYPASYGDNGVRFASDAAWLAWAGWCGHEHVRGGNVHGDPGAFPWARLVALTGQETDMPLTDDDAIKVARAVHAQKLFGSDVTIGKALYDTYQRPVAPSAAEIAAAIVVAFKALPAGTATVDDATIARIVKAVWDEGATRLVR
jgi:hypothetical protein